MNLQTVLFAGLLLVALIFLVIAVTTDHWNEISSYGSSHRGLWRICHKFSNTNTKVCVTFDKVPANLHVARAGLLIATFGYAVVMMLLYFVEKHVMKNFRIPAFACFLPFSSTLVAMAAFTADIYKNAVVKTISFSWSYYFGWTSLLLLVAAIMIGIGERQRIHAVVVS